MQQFNYCTVLEASDLNDDVIYKTSKKISANSRTMYLLDPAVSLRIYRLVEKFTEVLNGEDDSGITQARLAYNLRFSLPATLYVRIGDTYKEISNDLKNLSDLLEIMEYDDNGMPKKGYRLVLDDLKTKKSSQQDNEAVNKMVASLFQQIILLNLNIDIEKKSEIKKKEIKERFRHYYQNINEQIIQAEKVTSNLNGKLSDDTAPILDNINKALDVMKHELFNAAQRPLRIAVMGTKKAGKSVIINSLLKRDFAPTSPTLPTPNAIIYIPEPLGSKLRLNYKGQQMEFESDELLKSFIDREFKKAQDHTGEGSGLDNMFIHYPSAELNGFEIYDTPGPNFAGARQISSDDGNRIIVNEHERIAEACIEQADVCIFVMNYSNYLTNDEVDFLEKIRDSFAKNNKFYSLFIALNRIDERFAAEEEKSVNRLLDYISSRLEGLQYSNIIVFGTSALQSFYISQLRNIVEQCRSLNLISTDDELPDGATFGEDTLSDLRRVFKKSNEGSEQGFSQVQKTYLNFVNHQLQNMEDFCGYNNPTDRDLEQMSGIPQLNKHCRYIGEQKADLEIVDAAVSKIDTQMKLIGNALVFTELHRMRDQDREAMEKLMNLMEGLQTTIEKILRGLDGIMTSDKRKAMLYDADVDSKHVKKNAVESAKGRIESIVNNIEIDAKEMEHISTTGELTCLEAVRQDLEDMVTAINDETDEKLSAQVKYIGEVYCREVEENLQSTQEDISTEVEKIDSQLEQESDVATMFHDKFKLPTFPASLKKPEASKSLIAQTFDGDWLKKAANNNIHTEEYWVPVRRLREARGIFESIMSIFGKKYYENTQEKKSTKRFEVEEFKADFKEKLVSDICVAIDKFNDDMCIEQETKITEMFDGVVVQCQAFRKDYEEIFNRFTTSLQIVLDDKKEHSDNIQNDVKTLNELNAQLVPFFDVWNNVLAGTKEAK